MVVLFPQTEEYRVNHVQVATHVAEPSKEQLIKCLRANVLPIGVGEVKEAASVVNVLKELEKGAQIDDHHEGVETADGVLQRVWLPIAHIRG